MSSLPVHSSMLYRRVVAGRFRSTVRLPVSFLTAVLVLLSVLFPRSVLAIKVEPIFGNGMVLQRDLAAPVWGTGTAGDTISVEFGGQTKTAVVDPDGNWMVRLDPMPARSEPRTMKISSSDKPLTLSNILVGDVWVCAGQSNMVLGLAKTIDGDKESAIADYPLLRFFGAGHFGYQEKPSRTFAGAGWSVCIPGGSPSATAYYFARDLQKQIGIPLGLIVSALGGSLAEAWISRDAMAATPVLKPYVDAWDWVSARYKILPGDPATPRVNWYELPNGEKIQGGEGGAFKKWREAAMAAAAAGQPIPEGFPAEFVRYDVHGIPVPHSMHRAGSCFNRLVSPAIPFGIHGVIWYQGESNAAMRDPRLYAVTMQTLIADWRQRWGQGDFPYLIVQLPNFGTPSPEPASGNWPIVREQQYQLTKSVKNVYMAVSIDTAAPDEPDKYHPRNKAPIGQRLALQALGHIYGEQITDSGPVFQKMTIQGNKIQLEFDCVEGGLVATERGIPVMASGTPQSQLKGFAIAGEDRKFVWADAKIDGNHVIVSSDAVSKPVAVRYDWSNFPVGNLYNSAKLPAGPFRTDNWPLTVE